MKDLEKLERCKMKSIFKRLFSKSADSPETILPKGVSATFKLRVDELTVGILSCSDGIWEFRYADEFKKLSDVYNPIAGFSNLDKTYKSDTLWPFFQTRIPGLKQPAIIEILNKENIDKNNEYQLLKRFGKKSINNSYELELT